MADPADRGIETVKKHLQKILNSPGYYFSLFLSFGLSILLIHSFVGAIGPAGIKPISGSFFEFIYNLLISVFGQSFVDHLFSQGPFSLAFIAATFPLLIFIMVNSISQFDSWFSHRAEEIDFNHIAILALNHILISIISLAIVFVFFVTVSVFTNLVLGNIFFIQLFVSFFVIFGLWSYWLFLFLILKKKDWCLIWSFFILILFVLAAISDFMISDNYFTLFYEIVNYIIRWISPVSYFSQFITAIYYNQNVLAFAYSFLLVILIVIMNLINLFLLKRNLSNGD